MRNQTVLTFVALFGVALASCGAAPTATQVPAAATRVVAVQATATTAPATAAVATAAVVPTATTAAAPTPTKPIAPTATTAPAVAATAPSPTKAPAPVSEPAGGNTPAAIENAMRAFIAQKGTRMQIISDDLQGKVTTSTMEFVMPGRMHLIADDGMEILGITDQGVWQREGSTAAWMKFPIDASMLSSYFGMFDPKQIDSMMEDMVVEKFKSAGLDQISGKPMRVYEYDSVSDLTGTKLTSNNKIWIGVTDGLPYRLESMSDSAVKPGAKEKTIVAYAYDPNLKIEAPK